MKLLVIRDQHEFASHLCRLLEDRAENIIAVPVAWDAIGERLSLQKLIEQQQPDFVICAVRLANDGNKSAYKNFRILVEQLARASRKYTLPLFFLSTGAVLDGLKRPVTEEDKPQASSDYGKYYTELESLILRKLRKHIILRTTWWFSSADNSFLGEVVDHSAKNRLISLNSAAKGCPTAEQDIARVVLAILLQMEVGAENWGVYHYASADTALGFQFMEAIVAQASQFDSRINPKQLVFEHNEDPQPDFYFEPVILQCQKLLDNFGIHQRAWKSYLPATVKSYYASSKQHEEDSV